MLHDSMPTWEQFFFFFSLKVGIIFVEKRKFCGKQAPPIVGKDLVIDNVIVAKSKSFQQALQSGVLKLHVSNQY